jgi:hypothetical protein
MFPPPGRIFPAEARQGRPWLPHSSSSLDDFISAA